MVLLDLAGVLMDPVKQGQFEVAVGNEYKHV